MYCQICNNKYDEKDEFCKYCGVKLQKNEEKDLNNTLSVSEPVGNDVPKTVPIEGIDCSGYKQITKSNSAYEKKCGKCGAVYQENKLFCVKCGSEFAAETQKIICTACGEAVEATDDFCGMCGKKIDKSDAERKCTFCGAKSPSNSKYCCNCGRFLPYVSITPQTQTQSQTQSITQPQTQTQNSEKSQPKNFPMKYHKFMIYFWLFVSALYYFVMSVQNFISFTDIINSKYIDHIVRLHSKLGYLILTSLIFLILAIMALFARRALANYHASAKKNLITFRCVEIFSLLFGPLYLYFFDLSDIDMITVLTLTISLAVEIIWLACEYRYYDNREELFEY